MAFMAAAVCGRLDGVLLTGGLARSEMFVGWVRQRVSGRNPGRGEFLALVTAEGARLAVAVVKALIEHWPWSK